MSLHSTASADSGLPVVGRAARLGALAFFVIAGALLTTSLIDARKEGETAAAAATPGSPSGPPTIAALRFR